ncbi:MAG: hypothetical protein JWL86_6967 [Rhizobium sp.]|nr:hypothetical protein [Rhizobium sp.]
MRKETIKSWCPACKSTNTVFIGSGGYMTCSWAECPEPDYLKAWQQHCEDIRGSTWNMTKKEINHWKRYAELLEQHRHLTTEPKMVIEANPASQIFIDALPKEQS